MTNLICSLHSNDDDIKLLISFSNAGKLL